MDKLTLYNMALGFLGPARLTSLNENRPDRRELDAKYTGVGEGMLERGIWFFALRSIQLDPDSDVEPRFGLPYTYSLPTDYKRLRSICSDEGQTQEDRSYKREGPYIFSEQSRLFLTYVSNDPTWGWNLGIWPQLFSEAVAAELAYQSGLPITKDKSSRNDLFSIKRAALAEAKRVDAVDERVKFKPTSSWVNSRFNRGRDQRRETTS